MSDTRLTSCRLPRRTASLAPGDALRFRVVLDGIDRDAFVIRHAGALHAYLNTCRHQSRELDMGDGRFLEADGTLVCRHHGARYEPASGVCVEGPCKGASLTRLRLEQRDDGIWCVDVER